MSFKDPFRPYGAVKKLNHSADSFKLTGIDALEFDASISGRKFSVAMSAFNNIPSFSSRWAGLLPVRINASSCSRSSHR
jgi:hypothetical protein